jgi:hypothetical protein
VDPLTRLGNEEEQLEAACAVLSTLVANGVELGELACAHRLAAAELLGERPRFGPLLAATRATLVAVIRSDERALGWLREREHSLVRAYLSLDSQPLDDTTRTRLRERWLPAAFARFLRVDQLLLARERELAV